MSSINDIFQVDYLPEKKEIRINLPEEVWNSIDTVTLTRLIFEDLEEMNIAVKKDSAVEISEIEWELIDKAKRGNVSESFINDFEIWEEK